MRYSIQVVKIIAIFLFLLVFFLSAALTVRAAEPVELLNLEKEEKTDSTQITFTFSALPKFTSTHSGQRVELKLTQATAVDDLRTLPEGERVLSVLFAKKRDELIASILLRRHPQKVITEAKQNPARVVMDIIWKDTAATRPGVAFSIADMPPRKAGRRAEKLQQESPWGNNWNEFFRFYRTYWKMDLPINFTLPILPSLITDEESPLLPLQQHSDKNMFLSLIQTATGLSGLDQEQIRLRNLLLVEAQLRTGAKEAAISRLDGMRRKEGAESVRVDYLTAYGQALDGQPYVALLTLQGLLPRMEAADPLLPIALLLTAETAMAVGKDKEALGYLRTADIEWPEHLRLPVEMRIADAKVGIGEFAEAISIYQDLVEEPGLFEFYRYSLNRAGVAAFKNGNYMFAKEVFKRLIEPVGLEKTLGDDLLLFAAGAAAYEAGDMGWGMIGLDRVVLDRPESEGADRGALRLIDIKLINGGELELAQAVDAYSKLGVRSQYLPVREEGRFKSALALSLLGENEESVSQLMRFRREFSNSKLLREADLLVLQQLPGVIHNLLQQKNDLRAVVLAEQNRKLLLRSGFNKKLLRDLATAFERLGLYERSSRVLLYLLDRAAGKPEQQHLYLPLSQAYVKRQEFNLASKYAKQYLQKYPQGEDADKLFGILLDSFAREGRQEDLAEWLKRKNRPSSADLEIRAAYIYWQRGELQLLVASLERITSGGGKLEVKEMALLAESLYQLKKNGAAEKIYRQLYDDPAYKVQSRYRTAQILLRQQKNKAAISLLKQVVKEDGLTRWGKLAQDLLIQEQN